MTSPTAGGAMSVNNAARYLGVGRTTLYRMINAGDLPTRKIGRRTLLLRADLDRLLAALPVVTHIEENVEAIVVALPKEPGR